MNLKNIRKIADSRSPKQEVKEYLNSQLEQGNSVAFDDQEVLTVKKEGEEYKVVDLDWESATLNSIDEVMDYLTGETFVEGSLPNVEELHEINGTEPITDSEEPQLLDSQEAIDNFMADLGAGPEQAYALGILPNGKYIYGEVDKGDFIQMSLSIGETEIMEEAQSVVYFDDEDMSEGMDDDDLFTKFAKEAEAYIKAEANIAD